MKKYQKKIMFIETNHRNPSRHNPEERGLYCNWQKQNRKLINAYLLIEPRLGMFNELLALSEQYRRKNQYV